MKILEFKLQHKYSSTVKSVIDKNANVHIFYSSVNSTGKTTLMRAILYTLGFNIPDTELIKFKNYEFYMKLSREDNIYDIYRKDALIIVNGTEFDLPVDEMAVRTILFNITNSDLLNNLLGAIYFDQEKGWTLLNRGTIIGSNRFTIENFFRGLNDDDSNESYQLDVELNSIEKKIAQYKLMVNISEYQDEVNQNINKNENSNSYDEKLEKELIERKQRLAIVENELKIINDIIKKNKNFVDYLERKKIYVDIGNSTTVRVMRDNLCGYDEVTESNEARKGYLTAERNKLRQRIAEIEDSRVKQLTFETLPTIDEKLTQSLAEIKPIGFIEVNSILEGLKKEKQKINKRLVERTVHNNPWVNEVVSTVKNYAEELKIPEKYKIDIFTHKLKSKSGAILHKLVFIYKLAYIKALSRKVGYPVPIFCDSPNGREVELSTVREMLNIIKRDFSDHQLLIATIYNHADIFDAANIINMDGTLFDQDSLLNTNNKI